MAEEIGLEEKTLHIHIYLVSSSPIRFSTLKRHFPDAHIEQARGTSEENRTYVEKTGKWLNDPKADTSVKGTFMECGEMPLEHPGARNDLDQLYQLVKDGESNYEILEENPDYLLRLTDIERVRQTVKSEEFRTTFRTLNVVYIWGKTGTGKTRYIMEQQGYDAVYRVTDYEHPFDGYAGQDTLVLDEFHSQLKISETLNLLDGYPLELRCRYANKIASFTTVYIISNLDLYSQCPLIQYEQPETWAAFLRRIHKVVEFFPDGHRAEYSLLDYMYDFKDLDRNGNRSTKGSRD